MSAPVPSTDLKLVISQCSEILTKQTVQFIENVKKVRERDEKKELVHLYPLIPVFYVHGFNILKKLTKCVGENYSDPVLDELPHTVSIFAASELISAPEIPKLNAEGYLVEKRRTMNCLAARKNRYRSEVASEMACHIAYQKTYPRYPWAYELVWRLADLDKYTEIHDELMMVLECYAAATVELPLKSVEFDLEEKPETDDEDE